MISGKFIMVIANLVDKYIIYVYTVHCTLGKYTLRTFAFDYRSDVFSLSRIPRFSAVE